jgi:hypothetical protein
MLRFKLRFSLEQMHQNLRDLQRCVAVSSEQAEIPADAPSDEAKG